jgi:hypothetical protein
MTAGEDIDVRVLVCQGEVAVGNSCDIVGYRRLEGRWGPAVGGEATGGAGGVEATGEPEEESEAEADE